jgi:hypothetical protein
VNRFGYAIECTGTQTCNVSGNTIVGQWAELVSSDIPDATVTGNSVYGSGLWGDFEGEPGAEGYGSVNASNNSIDRNSSDAPAPISLADAQAGTGYTIVSPGGGSGTTGGGGGTTGGGGGSTGGGGTGGGGGGITSGGGGNSQISGATVTINSDSSVTVTFDSPSTDIASAVVDVISTIGRQNFPPTVVPGLPSASLTKPTVTITGLHPGWYIDFTIVATGSGSNPATYTSNTITVFMPGSSTAPWQGLLWGGISVLQTDPYVQ